MTRTPHTVPLRAITQGPSFHWFGYYDKLQFDPTGRFVLGMAVDFENRKPTADDRIRIGMIDLEEEDHWIELGSSCSWGWQQGCMLQWRPESATEIMWNDREHDRFVTRILDTASGDCRTLPFPFYALSPNGRQAVGVDFERIQDMRPGYGYPGIVDRNRAIAAPADSGAYVLDLETGTRCLKISIDQVQAVPSAHALHAQDKHYFNHLLCSPDGTRFIFLHRWRAWNGHAATGPLHTRMFTVGMDGSNLHLVDDSGQMSHFIWRDADSILGWTWQPSHGNAFYLFRDRADQVEAVGLEHMRVNGHCTYLTGRHVVLNDTYPLENRWQELYLYDVDQDERVSLGRFRSPATYAGEFRVDLHPRSSRDGRLVCIDSAHTGQGRQMYLLDIANLLG